MLKRTRKPGWGKLQQRLEQRAIAAMRAGKSEEGAAYFDAVDRTYDANCKARGIRPQRR